MIYFVNSVHRESLSSFNSAEMFYFVNSVLQGKSLSLICGALAWLKDFEEKQRQDLEELITSKVLPGMYVFFFITQFEVIYPVVLYMFFIFILYLNFKGIRMTLEPLKRLQVNFIVLKII